MGSDSMRRILWSEEGVGERSLSKSTFQQSLQKSRYTENKQSPIAQGKLFVNGYPTPFNTNIIKDIPNLNLFATHKMNVILGVVINLNYIKGIFNLWSELLKQIDGKVYSIIWRDDRLGN